MKVKNGKIHTESKDNIVVLATIVLFLALVLLNSDVISNDDNASQTPTTTAKQGKKEPETFTPYQRTLPRNKPVSVKENLTLTYVKQTRDGMILLRDSQSHNLYFRQGRTAFADVQMKFPKIAEDEVVVKVLPKNTISQPLPAPK